MPRNRQQIVDAIANLQSVIDASATSTSSDGHSATFDLEKAKQRLCELETELASLDGGTVTRPQWFNISMTAGPG